MRETGGQQAIFQLAAGKDGMLETEGVRLAVAQKDPLVFDAAPVFDHLRALDHQGAIGVIGADGIHPTARQPLLAQRFHDKNARGFEAGVDVAQDLQVVGLILKIAERREDTASEIERGGANETAHIFLHPLYSDAGAGCALAGAFEQERCAVDTGYAKAALRQCDGMAAWATAEIEDGA